MKKLMCAGLVLVAMSAYVYADSWSDVMTSIKEGVNSGKQFVLGDFLSSLNVPLPGQLKNVLNNILLDAPAFTVDMGTKSATLQSGANAFGQRIVAKIRMGYGSAGGEELPFITEIKEPKKASSSKEPMSQNQLKEMAPQKKQNLPVSTKDQVSAKANKVGATFSNALKQSFMGATPAGNKSSDQTPKEPFKLSETIKNKLKEVLSGVNCSIMLILPSTIKFSSIDSSLAILDIIQFSNMALVISSGDFFDADTGRTFYPGLNVVGTARMSGPLEKINGIIGQNLTEVTVQGVLDPGIWGSMITAELPGKINMGPMVETSGLMLRLALEEPTIAVSILTGLNIKIPESDPILLRAGLKIVPPSELVVGGWMEGMWKRPLGVPFVSVGDLGMQAGIDLTTAAASLGILSLSRVGFRGAMGFADKKVSVAMSLALSASSPDLLLQGKFEDGLTIEDVANAAAAIIEESAKIGGQSINIRDQVKGKIPNLGIDKAELYISPKDVSLAGKYYKKGLVVAGGIQLLGQKAELSVTMTPKEANGTAYMSNINLGPFKFTGAGPDKKSGTPDDGPIASLTIKTSMPFIELFVDGRAELDILGGISGETRIAFSTRGAEFKLATQIFNQFMSDLDFSAADVLKPLDWRVICRMRQEGLDNFAKLLRQGAEEIVSSANRDIEKAKKGVEDAQSKLNAIRDQRKKFEEENSRNVNNALNEMRQKVASLKKEKEALENQIRACKGQAPKEAQAEINNRVKDKDNEITAQQIQQEAAQLKARGFNPEQIKTVEQGMWARIGMREMKTIRSTRDWNAFLAAKAPMGTPAGRRQTIILEAAINGVPSTPLTMQMRQSDINNAINKLKGRGMPADYETAVREIMWSEDLNSAVDLYDTTFNMGGKQNYQQANALQPGIQAETERADRVRELLKYRISLDEARPDAIIPTTITDRANRIATYASNVSDKYKVNVGYDKRDQAYREQFINAFESRLKDKVTATMTPIQKQKQGLKEMNDRFEYYKNQVVDDPNSPAATKIINDMAVDLGKIMNKYSVYPEIKDKEAWLRSEYGLVLKEEWKKKQAKK